MIQPDRSSNTPDVREHQANNLYWDNSASQNWPDPALAFQTREAGENTRGSHPPTKQSSGLGGSKSGNYLPPTPITTGKSTSKAEPAQDQPVEASDSGDTAGGTPQAGGTETQPTIYVLDDNKTDLGDGTTHQQNVVATIHEEAANAGQDVHVVAVDNSANMGTEGLPNKPYKSAKAVADEVGKIKASYYARNAGALNGVVTEANPGDVVNMSSGLSHNDLSKLVAPALADDGTPESVANANTVAKEMGLTPQERQDYMAYAKTLPPDSPFKNTDPGVIEKGKAAADKIADYLAKETASNPEVKAGQQQWAKALEGARGKQMTVVVAASNEGADDSNKNGSSLNILGEIPPDSKGKDALVIAGSHTGDYSSVGGEASGGVNPDVMADGTSPDGPTGTSFSAPRVAAHAALDATTPEGKPRSSAERKDKLISETGADHAYGTADDVASEAGSHFDTLHPADPFVSQTETPVTKAPPSRETAVFAGNIPSSASGGNTADSPTNNRFSEPVASSQDNLTASLTPEEMEALESVFSEEFLGQLFPDTQQQGQPVTTSTPGSSDGSFQAEDIFNEEILSLIFPESQTGRT